MLIVVEFSIYLIATLFAAELLNRLIEKPIRKLNTYFDLKKAPAFNTDRLVVKLEGPIEIFPN